MAEATDNEKPMVERNPDGTLKPGAVLNPGGKPKGAFSIMTIIRKKMEEIPIGQTQSWRDQIAGIILDEVVVKRNPRIIQMLVEYMDGKPKQNIEIDANKESVDTLTELLREISKPKAIAADGSDTSTPPAPDAGPEPLA